MASMRERTYSSGETVWAVLYRHGGKQSSLSFGDPKSAEKFRQLVDLLGPDKALAVHRGEGPDDRLTINELADEFLEWKRTGPKKVTDRTLVDYRRNAENWVRPWFGHRSAESINEADVQKWADHMCRTLSPKSVIDRHMLLHSMYEYGRAKSRRLVAHNPCQETDLPEPGRKPVKGTTVAQWRAILSVADDRNPDAGDLIRYLGTVGWRFSEGIALPVGAVEDDGERLWVDMRQVFRIVGGRQVLVPDAAKSYAGFRRVPVPSTETAAMLRRRIVGKAPDALVFTNSRGNHWNQQTFLRETWPGLLTRAGLWQGPRKSPTPHWLRHMAVAVLAAGGASAHDIQRYVGHEDLKTTLGTYGSRIGGLTDDVLTRVDAVLSGHGPRGLVVTGEVVEQVVGELD